jgi:hypothetical protein
MAIFNSYVSLPEGIKIANDFWQESQSHYEIIEIGIISISYCIPIDDPALSTLNP